MIGALPCAVANLAQWSNWKPFTTETVAEAPTTPGVYLFKQQSALVYVGRAGERNGRGLRGRLTVYVSGRAPHSGLGNLALERALHDADWLRGRMMDLEAGERRTVQGWSALAVQHARLDVCWSSTVTRDDAVALERTVLDALRDEALWNRLR